MATGPNKAQFIETDFEAAVVSSVADETGQQRPTIQTASMMGLSPGQFPRAKAGVSSTNQTDPQNGSTATSPHGFMPGDNIFVRRSYSGGAEYEIVHHPGTIVGQGGGSSTGGTGNFMWNSAPWMGNSQAKQIRKTTTYPSDGTPRIGGQNAVQIQPYQDLQPNDVRGFVKRQMQETYPDFGSKAADEFFGQQNADGSMGMALTSIIDQTKNGGGMITDMIQQLADKGMSEAQKNTQMAQGLGNLRKQLNQSDMGGLLSQANKGMIPNIQGVIGQVFGQIMQMFQQVQQHAQNQNSQSPLTGNNVPLQVFEIFNQPLKLDESGNNPFNGVAPPTS